MARYDTGAVQFAPLYVYISPFSLPHTLLKAEKFQAACPDPARLTVTADKLRYYRYQKGLRQQDVADYAGIDRSTYISYENHGRDYYPTDAMRRIAELLEVEFESLLDDYNLFLHRGQGQQIKTLRMSQGMTQKEFAKLHNVNRHTVMRWETEQVQVYKSTWEKLFIMTKHLVKN